MHDSTGKRPMRWFAATFLLLAMCSATGAFAQQFTQWGWPQPYERISEKSIAWMKERGWWPMTVAYQPPWSGQNAIFSVMNQQKFLQARGI